MDIRTNYQYTYFIHPFVVENGKYNKYIKKLLSDKKCSLKIFKKENEYDIYKYFSNNTKKYMFNTFDITKSKIEKIRELPIETQSAIISEYPCAIFEYNVKKAIQGMTEESNGIFFQLQKFEIICFNTGICFLSFKSNIDNSNNFTDVLDFNYKFKDIKDENSNLNKYDKIRLQNDEFSVVKKFSDFIHNITGTNIESLKLDLDTERFITYAYTCIDQKYWNENRNFDTIKKEFIKFSNILPADNIAELEDNVETISKWKYAKIGITKQGVALFASTADINNYCILPTNYENQYLYTYILNLHTKIYLKQIGLEMKSPIKKIKIKARKKFENFTKNIWIKETTNDEIGALLDLKYKQVIGINEIYNKIKDEYDIIYKEMKIDKNQKVTIGIGIVLFITMVFNVLNYIKIIE